MALALNKGEQVLRVQPLNLLALQLVGVASCQKGDVDRGANYLRKAIQNGGDNADNRLNLAKALLELGQLEEATAVCAPSGVAATPELQRMHAEILKAQGRASESSWTYERLVAEHPDDFEAWNNLGNARHEMGDLERALEAFQHARQISPQSGLVHINMGRVFISMDRYEDACLILEKAALLSPKDPEPLLELGRTLTSIDHPTAALKALGDAVRLNPRDPRIFVAIGVALMDLSDHAKAEQAYQFALKIDATFPAALLNYGILLEKANRLDELDAVIALAQSSGAQGGEVDYLRALALSRKGENVRALELAKTIRSKAVNPATLAQFIGQLADRLGRIDEAFVAFEDMNRSMAQSPLGVGMDRNAYQRAIDGMIAKTTPEWFGGWSSVPVASEPLSPAFLVGFPRSGTTLLDTILMGHSATHVLEEIPIIEKISNSIGDFSAVAAMSETEIAELRSLYFIELEAASPPAPGTLVIDKNPLSMIRLPLIKRLFPDAKIILAMRHPCDVVLSCFMQNFKPTEAMASFLDLTNASRTYDRIFAYWEKCSAVMQFDFHMLRYEAMVDDVESEVRPLFYYLGLAWEADVLDHQKTAVNRGYIRTPSYAQVTEKIYSSASGRWYRYRDQMKEILPILEPWVDRYGYSLN